MFKSGDMDKADSPGFHIIEFLLKTTSGRGLAPVFQDQVTRGKSNPGDEDDGQERGLAKPSSSGGFHPAAWLGIGIAVVARLVWRGRTTRDQARDSSSFVSIVDKSKQRNRVKSLSTTSHL
jgi:hypothetical protein